MQQNRKAVVVIKDLQSAKLFKRDFGYRQMRRKPVGLAILKSADINPQQLFGTERGSLDLLEILNFPIVASGVIKERSGYHRDVS